MAAYICRRRTDPRRSVLHSVTVRAQKLHLTVPQQVQSPASAAQREEKIRIALHQHHALQHVIPHIPTLERHVPLHVRQHHAHVAPIGQLQQIAEHPPTPRLKGHLQQQRVYLGNFVGAALVAALCMLGHVFSAFDGRLAASVIAIAQTKASLPFGNAFVRGILCNFLVCIAVWMASAAKSVPGKILAVFFPIMTFVVAGFEHSVANMYYLTAGLLTAAQTGAAAEGLTWGRALACNLLPVTLGNLVGGVLLVGVSAWYLYLKQGKTTVNS